MSNSRELFWPLTVVARRPQAPDGQRVGDHHLAQRQPDRLPGEGGREGDRVCADAAVGEADRLTQRQVAAA